ncbi:YhcN/YlaJ family sporulation lipoprotein [Paenibacillus validus]|nr:YhcN/YlaJ family sporulation lipoprotein [Paenibacillus validus]
MFIQTGKGIALLALLLSVFAAGCTNKTTNQVRQQAAPQPAQNAPLTNAENRVEIAKNAADKIVRLNGVKQANVLVTRRNAYVAAVVDTPQTEIPQQLEEQIANEVRSTDPNIQHVYVSTNPEFVDRVNRYVQDIGQGRPVAGFVEEFSAMIQRLFPTAR